MVAGAPSDGQGDGGLRRLLLCCRAARSFALGVVTVALPFALEDAGYGATGINMLLAAGLAGATAQTQLARPLARHFGRVGALGLATAAMGAAACLLAFVPSLPVLTAACFLGALSVQPNISAQAPIEHATLASTAKTSAGRAHIFAWYNGVSTVAIAVGSLATGVPLVGPRGQILAVALLLLVASGAYASFAACSGTTKVSASFSDPLLVKEDRPLLQCPHWRRILGMAGLFAADAFAGSIALNSVIIHWLSSSFGVPEGVLGTLFAVCGVITTPSLWVAVWLGKRIGLINTMVFTHLPSNVCLILMPFMPDVRLVYALLLIRAALCQMDVPARESFMMSVVGEEERITCSSVITMSRALAAVAGPPVCALLWGAAGPGAPLVLAGGLKCAYDLSLLATFRAVKTDG